MPKNLLVIFDGNALVHRAYHALPPLTAKNGEVVNAVYGFASMLLKVIKELGPDYCAVAFDRKAPTFRHLLFEDYKAHRPETPLDLVPQIDRTRELVRAFNIPLFEMDGFEADDILGTLSAKAAREHIEVIIVTGDADAMQLVGPGVRVLYPKAGRQFSDTLLYGETEVEGRFGVKPRLVADYKALAGDASDNIPGVPGIGPKTAVKLLNTFGGIDDIYRKIDRVQPEKLRMLLASQETAARQGKKLSTIVSDMPLSLDLEACRVSHYDRQKVVDILSQLEFSSLLAKLPPDSNGEFRLLQAAEAEPTQARTIDPVYTMVNTPELLESMINRLAESSLFAFDVETTGIDPVKHPVVGLSFCSSAGEAFYVPIGHIGWEQVSQLEAGLVAASLESVFSNPGLPKAAHNAKFDIQAVASLGIQVEGLQSDTLIAAHLLGEKSLGLKELAFNHLGIEMTPISQLIGTGPKQINMSQVEVSRAADYACKDADVTFQLAALFEQELRVQELYQLFIEVEMPLLPVLMDMEKTGILLDSVLLQALSTRLAGRLMELEAAVYHETGHRFNINSPRQLGQVLFEQLKLTGGKKTKSGYSTDASVLESLKGTHPVVDLVTEFRTLAKLKSTYIDALPAMVNPATGRLHTSFNQTRTSTGRLSSSEPNLQNIPVRGELGREIRRAFIAPRGSVLVSGDYSQIDLRVLAHLSRDEVLLDTFHRDEDVHTATAVQLFGVKPGAVTADMRRLAKTVNFGVIYGMSGYGLEQATELNRQEAESFISTYFTRYPGVKAYLEQTRIEARTRGYVQTVLGRKRLIPEISSTNRNLREAAERMAINMPVQGTSADIIKVAMLDIHREFGKRGMNSRMLLQVHDELIFEVPEAEIDAVCRLVPELMCNSVKLSVPLKVDIKQGRSWGDMET